MNFGSEKLCEAVQNSIQSSVVTEPCGVTLDVKKWTPKTPSVASSSRSAHASPPWQSCGDDVLVGQTTSCLYSCEYLAAPRACVRGFFHRPRRRVAFLDTGGEGGKHTKKVRRGGATTHCLVQPRLDSAHLASFTALIDANVRL